MSNANYTTLGLTKDASPNDVKKAYRKLVMIHHPNKGGDAEMFKKIGAAFAAIKNAPPAKNNGQRTRVAGNITAFKAKVIDNFFRKNKPVNLVPGPGNTTLAVVPANVKTNKPTLALTSVHGEPHKMIEAPKAVHQAVVNGQITTPQLGLTGGNRQIVPYVAPKQLNAKNNTVVAPRNTSYSSLGVGRVNNTSPSSNTGNPPLTSQPSKPSFWSRFKGPSMPSIGRPSMPSFSFGGLFKSARQKAINAGNFMPSNAFNGAKNGYEYKTNRHGRGYYRLGSFYAKNPIKGLPAMGPVAMGFPVPSNGNKGPNNKGTGTNNGPKNMGTGTNNAPKNMGTGTNNAPRNMGTGTNNAPKNMINNGPRNMGTGSNNGGGRGGGSTRVRTGNVRTGATRIGNVKSTSGSSRVEGVRGGSSQSEGGRGGSGGSISFAPVIKINVPQAAAQSAVQALPPQERLALTNAGGYNNAAAAVSNAGGPATVERAINALNANGGNVNAAMQKTGLSRQVFNNVNKLGGPVTARRTLTAVKKVTMKTAPYVGQNATRRVAQNVYMGPNATRQNVYALASVPMKKHRKKRMEVKLSELNRVINAVKKKKLTSLVAHNVTRTNIHADNARLKSYYKRVIKAAILKRPFAKIAREHAKKLVVSPRVRKPRRKTTNLSYA